MQEKSMMELLWQGSHISDGNAAYIEGLFEQYLLDPNSVDEKWREYFDRLPRVQGTVIQDIPHAPIIEHFETLGRIKHRSMADAQGGAATEYERKQVRVVQLISAYRQRGHQKAKLDPLGLWQREEVPDLDLHFHQLSKADYDTVFQTGVLYIGKDEATLREIHEALEKTYCGSIGAEFMHIVKTSERSWIQQRMDGVRSRLNYSVDVKKHLLERLTAAEGLENFLASKYPGTKRFGLEGGESLIPMMDEAIQRVGLNNAKEVVIGMAHRGRLNMLVNILGKNPAELFDEFEGKRLVDSSGDVKYHQGFSSNVHTPGGEIHLALCFNPSHLEIVSPVVEGSVRARQDRREDLEQNQVVPIVIHGDAAFAGQGVVMETFQMSQTRGYKTGGTIHIVVNNQVGFTTSRPDDARSTEYCTNVAKMVQAPIFHVNGDDPEAVLFVTQMAVDFRNEFKKDVVIDLVCYRRRGHNEADEPSVTQPRMYKKIRSLETTRTLYARQLIEEGVINEVQDRQMINDYRDALENGSHVAKSLVTQPDEKLFVDWRPYLNHPPDLEWDTSYNLQKLKALSAAMNTIPEGFSLQRQVKKIVDDRIKMAAEVELLNWGAAEILAYATILDDGHPVRITGQDSGRGTFSHRHAVLHHQKTAETYIPLQHLYDGQPFFELYDSLLSEEAVLAFEYGYATTTPNALIVWEAQFGDFANGAQVVIDQFITSGEIKWERLCGLTLLLPHGYEGQGPEHSSARLERFLQLSAEYNIQVCTPTTPAQVFHMLRRQVVRPLRKPLIVMSPKSLLRHKQATSTLAELADGRFHLVLPETDDIDPGKVERLVLCSGKVYYDLRDKRRELEMQNVAILRIEQLYPFPEKELRQLVSQYSNVQSAVWCQEEPLNQGAWYSSQHHMKHVLREIYGHGFFLEYAGRPASAAPAAGYMSLHLEQQQQLVADALGFER